MENSPRKKRFRKKRHCSQREGPDIEIIEEPLSVEILEEPLSVEVIEEPLPDEVSGEPLPAQGTGRRPCRRAAIVAAERIFNEVRNYGAEKEHREGTSAQPSEPQAEEQATAENNDSIFQPDPEIDLYMYCEEEPLDHPIDPDISLEMECEEEPLSPCQERMRDREIWQYNMFQKNMYDLRFATIIDLRSLAFFNN